MSFDLWSYPSSWPQTHQYTQQVMASADDNNNLQSIFSHIDLNEEETKLMTNLTDLLMKDLQEDKNITLN